MIKKIAVTFVIDKETTLGEVGEAVEKISKALGKNVEIYWTTQHEDSPPPLAADKIKAISWFYRIERESYNCYGS